MKRRIFAFAALLLATTSGVSGLSSAHAAAPAVGSFTRMNATMDQKTITIQAPSSSSPGRWSFTSSNPSVATINGNVITLVARGYSRITATQAASGQFDSVSKITELLVTKGTPTVGPLSDITVSYAAGSVKIIAPTNSSGLPWQVTNGNPSIATYKDGVLTFKNVGLTQLTFTQPANDNWNSAVARMNVSINPVKPTLGTFGNISIGLGSIGSLTLTPPTSNSSGAWSFSSSNTAVANVVGSTVYPVGIGSATITANQAQLLPYSAATTSMTMTVTGTSATVSQWQDMIYDITLTKSVVITPPASTSTGAWTYSVGDSSVATISGSTLNLLKPGTTTLTANQAATGTYNASGPFAIKITVLGVPTLAAPASIIRVAGDPSITFAAPKSNSSGAFTYSSSDPKVISVTGNLGTIVGAGTATITATQAADSYWKQGTTTFTVQVNGLVPSLGPWAAISIGVGEKKTITPPTSNSKGVWSYTSNDPTVLSVNDGVVTGLKVGSTVLMATQAASGLYGLSNIVQAPVTVTVAATPSPTPSPSATPSATSKPSVTPKPTVSPSPTSSAAAKPTVSPKPTPGSGATTGTVSVKVTTGVGSITVTSSSKTLVVFIDGEVKVMGKNAVPAGKHLVTIRDGAKVLYSKSVTVK